MSNNLICRECGMTIKPKEFHPYEFCILWKNGQDPRELYQRIIQRQSSDKQEEIQRLRAALEEIKSFPYLHPNDDTRTIQRIADEALTQPATHQMEIENIKQLLQAWNFRSIAEQLESYEQGVVVELVELCEKLVGVREGEENE